MNATPILRAPTVYTNQAFDAFVADDFGSLVPTDYAALKVFVNNEFTSTRAALEFYGAAQSPLPSLI